MANDKKFKKGPRKSAVGCTQASVTAVKNDDEEVNKRSVVAESGSACRAVVVAKERGGKVNAETHESHVSRQK
jgi:hypothetical protein